MVHLACRRHLRDLVDGSKRGLTWNAPTALFYINFFRLLHHSKGEWARRPFELQPWQKFVVGSVFGWIRKDGTRRFRTVYEELPRKQGKALEVETPVATPEGWQAHGALRAGDHVFGPDGLPKRVLAVTAHHVGQSYALSFSDRTQIIAHERHEWDTRRTWYTGKARGERGPLPLVETKDIAATIRFRSGRRDLVHGIAVAAPLQLPAVNLSLPPYVLGAWLGDGSTAGAIITVGRADDEMIDLIRAEGVGIERSRSGNQTSCGLKLLGSTDCARGHGREHRNSRGRCLACDRGADRARRQGQPVRKTMPPSIRSVLRDLGVLGRKHVPPAYLRASEQQRLALLQGLMDTDGTVSAAGQCEFTTILPALRDGFLDLARGLGFKPSLIEGRAKLNGRDCGPKYRIQFWSFADRPAFRLSRKRRRLRPAPNGRARSTTRMIVSADPVGDRLVNCIEVEGGMYLAGEAMIPTHNSTKLAGVGLACLMADEEPGAEIYTAATKRDQARIIFDEAKRMVRASPELRRKLGIFKLNLSIDTTASKFEPLSSDERTLDGLNPHAVLIDELHKHKSRALLDVLDSAVGSRRQPLIWIITTAGDDAPESVYAAENDYAMKVLEGVVEDDSAFAFIATIDKGDRWDDPKAWAKANPNLGVSVKLDDLKRMALKAAKSPSAQASFKRLRLNVRMASANQAIDLEVWRRNTSGRFDPAAMRGRRCYGGLDMSSKVDLTAWVKLFPPIEEETRWRIVARFWMPADTVADKADRDKVQYQRWIDDGWIEPTGGNVIDHNEIQAAVLEDHRTHELLALAFDPWNATQLSVGLQSEGVPVFEFIQGIRSYTAPTKELEAMLLAGKLDHGDNPVLAWMASNLMVTQRGDNKEVMPSKKHSRGRIDGMTGLIMAIGRSMLDNEASPYSDGRGLLVI